MDARALAPVQEIEDDTVEVAVIDDDVEEDQDIPEEQREKLEEETSFNIEDAVHDETAHVAAIMEDDKESEYNETELDIDEHLSASDDDFTDDTTEPARRRGYLQVCNRNDVVPVSSFAKSPGSPKLTFPYHGLGDKSVDAILSSLNGSTVQSIDLQENRITSSGIAAVTKSLCTLKHIVELNLANNSLGTAGARPICAVMHSCLTLEKINLSGNLFSDRDAGPIAEEVGINPHLKYVDLSNNNFGDFSGLCFGPALQNNRTLISLDLSWNQFRKNGGISISNGLRQNSTLTSLKLGWNALGDIAAIAFAEMLKVNNTLTHLDLSNNRIGLDPCKSFAEALHVNRTLTSLILALNPLHNDGVLALVAAAKANSTVTEINLARVPVMQSIRDQIDELVCPTRRLLNARAAVRKANRALILAQEAQAKVIDGRDQLQSARAAFVSSTHACSRLIAKAHFDNQLNILCAMLPGTATLLREYTEATEAADLSYYRGGKPAAVARKAVVAHYLAGNDKSTMLSAVVAAVKAEAPEESDENITSIARDAVSGTAANAVTMAVYLNKLTDLQSGPTASTIVASATKAAEAVYVEARGPAMVAARAAYMQYRTAHPKDPSGALAIIRSTYLNKGGVSGYDPVAEIVEEEATTAAREALTKTLVISTRESEQETGLENATKIYRSCQGKREPVGSDFLNDTIKLFLVEKSLQDEIGKAIQTYDAAYSVAVDGVTNAERDLDAAVEHDISEGRRPGLVFIVDEASGGIAHVHKEVDPFLMLEQYIQERNLRLVDMFLTFDNDRSGKISYEEFVKGIKLIGLDLTSAQITYLIEVADLDGDGHIDYKEFCELRKSTKMTVALDIIKKRLALRKMQSTTEGRIAFGHMAVKQTLPGNTGGGLSIFHRPSFAF